MNEKENDVLILLAKCKENHKTYGIRAENRGKDNWALTWAFPIKEDSAKREGYDKLSVKGNIIFDESYPGCPYCGKSGFTLCGTCGHLSCTNDKNGIFTCEWCGTKGTIGAYTGEEISAGGDI